MVYLLVLTFCELYNEEKNLILSELSKTLWHMGLHMLSLIMSITGSLYNAQSIIIALKIDAKLLSK